MERVVLNALADRRRHCRLIFAPSAIGLLSVGAGLVFSGEDDPLFDALAFDRERQVNNPLVHELAFINLLTLRRRAPPRSWSRPRCWSRTNNLKLRHHSVVLMLHHVTVEHVHAEVIGELQLDLKTFARREVPGLLHGLVWVTWSSVATQALL